VEFEVFEKGEVRRGIRQAPKGEGSSFLDRGGSGGSRGFVKISFATRNLEVKYRDSRRVRFRERVRVLKLEGFNLKVKLKLKCLKGVPEGGIPEGGIPEGGVPEGGVVVVVFEVKISSTTRNLKSEI
jgi:hypothetical protein